VVTQPTVRDSRVVEELFAPCLKVDQQLAPLVQAVNTGRGGEQDVVDLGAEAWSSWSSAGFPVEVTGTSVR